MGSSSKGVAGMSPLQHAAMGQFRPDLVPHCTASGLTNSRASQKVSGRGTTVATLTSGQSILVAVVPTFASDITFCSVIGYVYTTATNNLIIGTTSPAQGATTYPTDGTFVVIITNTPYSNSTITGTGYSVRYVSGALRVKYNGAALYRGGTMWTLNDPDCTLCFPYGISGNTNAALTVLHLSNQLQGSSDAVRHNFQDKNEFLFTVPGQTGHLSAIGEGGDFGVGLLSGNIPTTSGSYANNTQAITFGNTGISTYTFSCAPVAYAFYQNPTGQTIQLDLEWIEHWEVDHPQIAMLRTPSAAHPAMATAVAGIVSFAKQAHASTPHMHIGEMIQSASKSSAVRDSMSGMEKLLGPVLSRAAGSIASGGMTAGLMALGL
jgi:hypothetical protein